MDQHHPNLSHPNIPIRHEQAHLQSMIHVRIVSTYPPLFGLPEETIELTLKLPPEFARTGDEAHARIVEALKGDENFEIPSVDEVTPFVFSPKVVRSVAVWETG